MNRWCNICGAWHGDRNKTTDLECRSAHRIRSPFLIFRNAPTTRATFFLNIAVENINEKELLQFILVCIPTLAFVFKKLLALCHDQAFPVFAAPSLAEKYSKLKSLTVSVGYFAPEGKVQYRQLTYDVNLSHAKSIFRLDCPNNECVQGDFDLTKELAVAATKRAKTVAGELCCIGWQNKATIKKMKCNHVLRYKLKLGF